MANDVFIVAAKRTPVGAFLGALSEVPAVQLGAAALKAAIAESGVAPEHITELYFGAVLQANMGQAPATQVALAAGLPNTTPCTLVNKVCASGAKAIMLATQSIRQGDNEIVAAGGMESMSLTPHYVTSYRTGNKYGNTELLDGIVRDGLQDVYHHYMMGYCAEMAAEKFHFTRESQDEFTVHSYQKAQAAQKAGKFMAEIAPFTIQGKKGPIIISEDEEPGKVLWDKIPTLKPAFKKEGGTVTAANASKLNDGASAVVLASEAAVKKYNLKPLARVVSFADAAKEPEWFTIAPADAVPIALKRGGLSSGQIDLFEINEAFAVVAQANQQLLDIPTEKLNVLGGAVALGHALGSSGSRLIVTMAHALHSEGKQYGAMGICNGGGGASAIVLERV